MRCLSIHLTDLCNSRCAFCVVGAPLAETNSVDYDQVVSFLKENAGRKYDLVNLHGGEPTVHPRFLETLELIRSLGYPEVHLQTNGLSLADADFARQSVDLGVRLFIISLHGDTASIQDEQTGVNGGFARTLQGIRNVVALGGPVRTNTVITRQNLDRLSAISQLAVDSGVEHLNFSNLHPVGSAIFGLSRRICSFANIRRYLYPALDIALTNKRRATLEGFPCCTVTERLDLSLNNEYREICMLYKGRILENYDQFMIDVMRQFGEPCKNCTRRRTCGGVYGPYIALNGWGEFAAVSSPEPENIMLGFGLAEKHLDMN